MTTIAPLGAGLELLEKQMEPEELMLKKRQREFHYVISLALSMDLTDRTYLKLSTRTFPQGRITVLQTFHYPTKNRSEQKFTNPQSEPDIIAWEMTAFHQVTDLYQRYQYYGMTRLNSITGCEPALVKMYEKILLPDSDREEDYSLPSLENYLTTEAAVRLEGIADTEYYERGKQLLEELIQGVYHAKGECSKWINDTEMDINKTLAGKPGKTMLDPLDFRLYKAMGVAPRADIIERMRTSVPTNSNVPAYVPDPTVVSGMAMLQARLDQMEREREREREQKAAKPEREMKMCPRCATMIFVEAVYCRYCDLDLTPPPPPVEEPKPATAATRRQQQQHGGS